MRLIIVCLLIANFTIAQQSNQQIAYQYYIDGEFEKAITHYEELMSLRFSVAYYVPYYNSLIKLGRYKKAENLAKKFIRRYPKQLQYQLGVIIAQLKSGKVKRSETALNKLMNGFDGNSSQTISMANTFVRNELYQKALEVYIFSENINSKNNFGIQKAQIYAKIEEVELMLTEYLNEMERNPQKKQLRIMKN